MRTVAVTGVSGLVGRRVRAGLEQQGLQQIIAIDGEPSAVGVSGGKDRGHGVTIDLSGPELKSVLEGAQTLVHLAWTLAPARHPAGHAVGNVETFRHVLDAAGAAGVRSIVLLSSATVYGAWPDNPVPLTESAPLRPNPGFVDAVHHAEAERLLADWADDHPGTRVAILRPVTVVGPGVDTWLSRALSGDRATRVTGSNLPRQFVHVDDVAAAVILAAVEPLTGTFNVTPDGWVAESTVRALGRGRPVVPLPRNVAAVAALLGWEAHLAVTPPALLPLLEHPWVVANDRLRAAGWQPRHSNEEALVAGRPGSRWREMSPRRRQETALGAAAMLIGGAVATGFGLVTRRRRH
jgi:nucleoside-diphosphate-sugar epimerase